MIIYRAFNKITGKSYVGQTTRSLAARKAEHLRSAQQIERQKHPTLLSSAIREFGSGAFEWEILEECPGNQSLNDREIYYILLLKTLEPYGYNMTRGGAMDESMAVSIREKIAASVRQVHKDPLYRAKVYPKLKGLAPPNKGVPMTEEQKAKVGAARKAVYDDPTYINPNLGQKRTPEQLKNLAEGYKKRDLSGDKWYQAHADQYTPEVREKMAAKKRGKKPANTKLVQCIETGQIFSGLNDAAKALGLPKQSIYLQIKGKLKKVGGKYTFKYVEDKK